MNYVLYKPHVLGPENHITTPDLVIDQLSIHAADGVLTLPVHRLHSATELQSFDGAVDVAAAYALVASGGGCILSLAAIVQPAGSPASAMDCVIARSAWRLRNIADHMEKLTLTLRCNGELAAETRVDDWSAGEDKRSLPRGVAALQRASKIITSAPGPVDIDMDLRDPVRNRVLSLTAKLVPATQDSWGERPEGRYTVGPVGDVEHYI